MKKEICNLSWGQLAIVAVLPVLGITIGMAVAVKGLITRDRRLIKNGGMGVLVTLIATVVLRAGLPLLPLAIKVALGVEGFISAYWPIIALYLSVAAASVFFFEYKKQCGYMKRDVKKAAKPALAAPARTAKSAPSAAALEVAVD